MDIIKQATMSKQNDQYRDHMSVLCRETTNQWFGREPATLVSKEPRKYSKLRGQASKISKWILNFLETSTDNHSLDRPGFHNPTWSSAVLLEVEALALQKCKTYSKPSLPSQYTPGTPGVGATCPVDNKTANT